MTSHSQRKAILSMVDQAVTDGACREKACQVIGIASSTLGRWRIDGTVNKDARPDAVRPAQLHQYTKQEREHIIATCNKAEFASLAPSQIVPIFFVTSDQKNRNSCN